MNDDSRTRRWTRHFVYRTECTRTTWQFRVGILAFVAISLWATRGWWTVAVARSLVCEANASPSDAILVENFDPDYLVFDRAAQIRRTGIAARVLVPIQTDPATSKPNAVALGIAEVMAGLTHIDALEIVPTREIEPISMTAAEDLLRFAERTHIRSIIVVSPLFRSRRSALVYGAILGRAGIAVRCEPTQTMPDIKWWTGTWHGVQNVTEQWLKLQYYKFYVLPFLASND
jgi:hypothetical protein